MNMIEQQCQIESHCVHFVIAYQTRRYYSDESSNLLVMVQHIHGYKLELTASGTSTSRPFNVEDMGGERNSSRITSRTQHWRAQARQLLHDSRSLTPVATIKKLRVMLNTRVYTHGLLLDSRVDTQRRRRARATTTAEWRHGAPWSSMESNLHDAHLKAARLNNIDEAWR